MAKPVNQYVTSGDTEDYTPSGVDVTAGTIVPCASGQMGIADNDIKDGEKGSATVEGVIRVIPESSIAATVAIGDYLRINYANGEAETPIAGNTTGLVVGREPASGTATHVHLKMNRSDFP